MATAAGTPALAMFVISSRRVIATSVLFLVRFSASRFDSFRTGLLAAFETLRVDVGSATERPCDRSHHCRRAYANSSNGAVNRRVSVRRSGEVNGNGFEGPHRPNHAFLGATHAGDSGANRPTIGNFIEMARGTGGVSDGPLAAHFVEAPALAVAFVAECSDKPARVKVRAA